MPSPDESPTELRIEQHRRIFQAAKGVGPMLRLDELNSSERALIVDHFWNLIRNGTHGPDEIDSIYATVLHSWGVMCPHPQRRRRYDGFQLADTPLTFAESRWFDCQMCGTSVINR